MARSVLDENLPLGELVDRELLGELARSFSDSLKLGVHVFDRRPENLGSAPRPGPLCPNGGESSQAEGRQRCQTALLRAASASGPAETKCTLGCRFAAVPVECQFETLGRVVTGPLAPDTAAALEPAPTGELVAKVISQLAFAGQQRTMTSRLHLAVMEEHHRELTAKHAALLDTKARLEEMDRLKSAFLATVSHELRTPLTSVLGYSEMLLEGLAGELAREQREYVGTIREKGSQLLGLISALLDISRIEAGTVRLTLSRVKPGDLVEAALRQLRPIAEKKGLTLTSEVGESLPTVEADKEKLQQVVANVISNAVKFTAAPGSVRVVMRAERSGGEAEASMLELLVEDSGIGIAREHHHRIFDAFYQVDSSSTRAYGGVGLGLTIARSFVEAHGGRVRVESARGQGARFLVALPVKR
jgi:signal transduction histidine kinase